MGDIATLGAVEYTDIGGGEGDGLTPIPTPVPLTTVPGRLGVECGVRVGGADAGAEDGGAGRAGTVFIPTGPALPCPSALAPNPADPADVDDDDDEGGGDDDDDDDDEGTAASDPGPMVIETRGLLLSLLSLSLSLSLSNAEL